MVNGVLDAIERPTTVGAVLGLEAFGQFSDCDFFDAWSDDAALDRGALALLQQAPSFPALWPSRWIPGVGRRGHRDT
jgi:hypothetical protein